MIARQRARRFVLARRIGSVTQRACSGHLSQWNQLEVACRVAEQMMCQAHEQPLEHRVLTVDDLGGVLGLCSVQKTGACPNGWRDGLAGHRGRGDVDAWVATQAHELPALLVRPEEGSRSLDSDVDSRADWRSIELVGRQCRSPLTPEWSEQV